MAADCGFDWSCRRSDADGVSNTHLLRGLIAIKRARFEPDLLSASMCKVPDSRRIAAQQRTIGLGHFLPCAHSDRRPVRLVGHLRSR